MKVFAANTSEGTPVVEYHIDNPKNVELYMTRVQHMLDTVPPTPVKEVPKSKKQVKPEPITGAVKSTVKPITPPVIKPVIVKPKQIIKPVIKIK